MNPLNVLPLKSNNPTPYPITPYIAPSKNAFVILESLSINSYAVLNGYQN